MDAVTVGARRFVTEAPIELTDALSSRTVATTGDWAAVDDVLADLPVVLLVTT